MGASLALGVTTKGSSRGAQVSIIGVQSPVVSDNKILLRDCAFVNNTAAVSGFSFSMTGNTGGDAFFAKTVAPYVCVNHRAQTHRRACTRTAARHDRTVPHLPKSE